MAFWVLLPLALGIELLGSWPLYLRSDSLKTLFGLPEEGGLARSFLPGDLCDCGDLSSCGTSFPMLLGDAFGLT